MTMPAVRYEATTRADVNRAWDGAGAVRRLRAWATDGDETDWAKFRRGFAWYDRDADETQGGHKLPHHDVVDGELSSVWRGVAAAMAALLGGRGGVDIPSGDRRAVYDHLVSEYKLHEKEAPAFRATSIEILQRGEWSRWFADTPIPADLAVRAGLTVPDSERIAPPGVLHGHILTRATGTPDDGDMAAINKLARSPLTAEEVYVFDGVPSTDALDSYWTRQAVSSLQNYVMDCLSGVAIMNSHRTNPYMGGIELPIGRSFWGELQPGDARTELHARGYLLRGYQPNEKGPGTDTIIRGIEGGVISDLSIGFRPGWYRCSICGMDVFSQQCAHFPGLKYDGIRAYAWVEDAHMGEYSLVYDGATPGAGIRKAELAFEAGSLDRKAVAELEDVYQVRLVKRWAVPEVQRAEARNGGGETTMDKTTEGAVTGAELIERVIAVADQRAGRKLSAATIAAMQAVHDKIMEGRGMMDEAAGMMADMMAEEGDSANAANSERIATLERRVADLEPLAALGTQYRGDLIEQTLADGVRAFGNSFQQEMHRKMLERATLDEVKGVQIEWQGLVKARFGDGGRQTTAVSLPTNGAEKPARPAGQYRG